jgi:hypothetical protein
LLCVGLSQRARESLPAAAGAAEPQRKKSAERDTSINADHVRLPGAQDHWRVAEPNRREASGAARHSCAALLLACRPTKVAAILRHAGTPLHVPGTKTKGSRAPVPMVADRPPAVAPQRAACSSPSWRPRRRTTLTVYAGLVESQRAELLADLEAALR